MGNFGEISGLLSLLLMIAFALKQYRWGFIVPVFICSALYIVIQAAIDTSKITLTPYGIS